METELQLGPQQADPQRGALLVEMMIGSVVIMIALSAILSVVLSSAVVRRQNEEITLAYTAASNAMEELRTLDVSELLQRNKTGFAIPSLDGDEEGLRPAKGDDDGLPGALTVALDSRGSNGAVYHVVATVVWVGAKGKQRLSLESLIGTRSMQ